MGIRFNSGEKQKCNQENQVVKEAHVYLPQFAQALQLDGLIILTAVRHPSPFHPKYLRILPARDLTN